MNARWRSGILGAYLLALVAPSTATERAPTDVVPDELLVGFRAAVADPEQIYRPYGAVLLETVGGLPIHRIRIPAQQLDALEQAIRERPEVRFVERNRRVPLSLVANDPYFPMAWHLARIGAPAAWDTTQGSQDTVIAVVDSGIDATHPDLATQLVAGTSLIGGGTGDRHGHGTAVAGVAAAASNNGIGVAAVAWKTRLMPIVVADASGYADWATIARGVVWAADHGARIINLSFENVTDSSTITAAAQDALARGVLVVASAGNCGCLAPSAANPAILSVSATTATDGLASFSSRGQHVDISGPGIDVATTARGGGYMLGYGSSMASPVVAGAAALVMATNPALTPGQVATLLAANADDLGPAGWDPGFGHGRVNVSRAVAAAAASLPDLTPPAVRITAPAPDTVVSGTVTVLVSASDAGGVSRVELDVDGTRLARDTIAPYSFAWDTSTVADGRHILVARAVDAAGNVATSSPVVVVVENIAPLAITTTRLPAATVGLSYRSVLGATGGIPPYTWSRVGGSLPPGLTLSAAGVLSGTPTGSGQFTFRIRVASSGGLAAEQDLRLGVRLILDNAPAGVQDTAGGRSFTGTWCRSPASGFYGPDSLQSCGGRVDTYRWTPGVGVAGPYDVYVRWTADVTRGSAVAIAVQHAEGRTTRTFDQRASGGRWVLHGRYHFSAGTVGYVETSDAGAGGPASADAVRLVPTR
jgi:subtilisin family serine protease